LQDQAEVVEAQPEQATKAEDEDERVADKAKDRKAEEEEEAAAAAEEAKEAQANAIKLLRECALNDQIKNELSKEDQKIVEYNLLTNDCKKGLFTNTVNKCLLDNFKDQITIDHFRSFVVNSIKENNLSEIFEDVVKQISQVYEMCFAEVTMYQNKFEKIEKTIKETIVSNKLNIGKLQDEYTLNPAKDNYYY
jgi:hypothetical protein